MKKIFNKAVYLVLAIFVFSACSKDIELFEASDSFVAFRSASFKVSEKDSLQIPVVVGALKGSEAVTVTYQVTSGTAVRDSIFTIATDSSLVYTDGFGTQYIVVKPIDDDVFTGNRSFTIKLLTNSANYPFGAIDRATVTIVDDEHPLKLVLGAYVFAGLDAWGDPFSANITTSPVDGDLTMISFPLDALIGYGAPPEALVLASVDLVANTFKIKTGQSYPTFGYGPCMINGYDADGNDLVEGDYVTGTIDASGNITMNEMLGVIITSGNNEGLSFMITGPGAVWTKQ
jgi:hypothetical protein